MDGLQNFPLSSEGKELTRFACQIETMSVDAAIQVASHHVRDGQVTEEGAYFHASFLQEREQTESRWMAAFGGVSCATTTQLVGLRWMMN